MVHPGVGATRQGGPSRRFPRAALVAFAIVSAACSPTPSSKAIPTLPDGYVGSAACMACHADEGKSWESSHHRRAWQPATRDAVHADFGGRKIVVDGIESRFEREHGAYVVATDGPDGRVAPFTVTHVFGFEPLEQFLVALPGGRLQALPFAWDTRDADAGGHRWYHLNEAEHPKAGDALHWTSWLQNWNAGCADCHATFLKKGYDATTHTYRTTWAEDHVGCEACHGPGSAHAKDPPGGHLAPLATATAEIEVCAPCHSRRSQLADGYQPGANWLDYYRPAIAVAPLYQDDGQILEEDYEYGSFLQSKMSAAGVRCSDCHDVHTGGLRAQGNRVCTRCHSPSPPAEFPQLLAIAGNYDSDTHHFHVSGSSGAQCVACHMPTRTYMGIDDRHDHSLRPPRPDLSVAYGVSNACVDCHKQQTNAWAAQRVVERFGQSRKAHPDETLIAGERRQFAALPKLIALAGDPSAPPMSRAAALALLGGYARPEAIAAIEAGLTSPIRLLQIAALDNSERLPPEHRWPRVAPLLKSEALAVRADAGRALADWRGGLPAGPDRDALDRAIAEYRTTQVFAGDWPQGATNLGLLEQSLGDAAAAEASYKAALAIEPNWPAAAANLADLYRATHRDVEGGPILERVAASTLADGGIEHALGLWYVRNGQKAAGLDALGRAVERRDADPSFVYAYAVALADAHRRDEGIAALKRGLDRYPDDLDMSGLLALLLRDAGRTTEAIDVAKRRAASVPGDAEAARLVEALKASG